MIQFNLLPDVKLAYIKTRRTKRLVIAIALLISTLGIATFLILLSITLGQNQHINNLTSNIKSITADINKTEDLDKILTIQNQLRSLPDMHTKKPVNSRLFSYIDQLIAGDTSSDNINIENSELKITIKSIDIDHTISSVTITGTALAKDNANYNLKVINKFVDTLKFAAYTVETEPGANPEEEKNAFSEVVLGSFEREDAGTTFEVKAKFDPAIFDYSKKLTLKVPSIISTRSVTEKAVLAPNTSGGGN